jgi:aminopeptidase YwaD
MRSLFFVSFLVSTSITFGQIDEVRRITEKLCSPEFHGRGYVNHGDSIAAVFLAAEFKSLGVKPYKKGSYYQDFELDVNTFPGAMSVSQNGKEFTPGLHFSIDPSSKGGRERLIAKEIPPNQVLNMDFIKEAFDKVALGESKYNALLFDKTKISADTLKLIQGLSNEIAQYIPVIEVVNKKFMWSVGRAQQFHPLIQIQDSVLDKSAPIDINIDAEMIRNYKTQNVVAYIPSKRKCAKTIMFTAHYDHLGRMGSDTYFPGANDNASGTAMLLTMANHFLKNPSKYNIMFVAFAGEEAGLVGSKYFVENPILKLKKIKFLVNLDIMGSGEDGITVVNATLFEEEFEMLQSINKEKNLLTKVKKRGEAANSDHYWFTVNDVPAFFIYTMGPNKFYHDIFDKYDELSFLEYEDITTLLIEFVRSIETR